MQLFSSACQVVGGIVFLALLSNWGEGTTKKYDTPFVVRVKALVNNAHKYYDLASEKNLSPIRRLSHISMALAFALSAKTVVSDEDIENVTDLKMHSFIHNLQSHHKKALKALKG